MSIVKGVSRMGDNDKAILVGMVRPLTDDELRKLHAYLGKWDPDEISLADYFHGPNCGCHYCT